LDAGSREGLSQDERDRATRLVTETLRNRWSRSRGALRRILGLYLRAAPSELRFAADAGGGKPSLAGAHAASALRFNLSHAGALALCAVAVGAEVGVDMERTDRFDDADSLAVQVMTPRERDAYARMSAPDQAAMFFRVWTMKEALAKAIGIGLGLPFDQIDLVDARAGATIPWAGTEWHLRPLALEPGFAGAVALGAPITALRLME
jgi:4'-phosphopantetheinyl transferase